MYIGRLLFGGLGLGGRFMLNAFNPNSRGAYLMSTKMSNHDDFAGEIITLSTILCPVSMTLGLVALSYFGYI